MGINKIKLGGKVFVSIIHIYKESIRLEQYFATIQCTVYI